MIDIEGKKYRNLPEQVEYLTKLVETLQASIDAGKFGLTKDEVVKGVGDGSYTTSGIKTESSAEIGGTLDVEGKATFGGDSEVDGKLSINSVSDLVFKDGTSFMTCDTVQDVTGAKYWIYSTGGEIERYTLVDSEGVHLKGSGSVAYPNLIIKHDIGSEYSNSPCLLIYKSNEIAYQLKINYAGLEVAQSSSSDKKGRSALYSSYGIAWIDDSGNSTRCRLELDKSVGSKAVNFLLPYSAKEEGNYTLATTDELADQLEYRHDILCYCKTASETEINGLAFTLTVYTKDDTAISSPAALAAYLESHKGPSSPVQGLAITDLAPQAIYENAVACEVYPNTSGGFGVVFLQSNDGAFDRVYELIKTSDYDRYTVQDTVTKII